MTTAMKFVLASVLLFVTQGARQHLRSKAKVHAASLSRGINWRHDCTRNHRRNTALTQMRKTPGAGMHPEIIKPYVDVFMDGYLRMACIKDSMFEFGDKFGKNKFGYNLGERYNVSIVRYTELVAKEDREPMKPDVCFRFCRTIPGMKFFGLVHGRDCYCTSFVEQTAGDSSACDEICEGSSTEMCGGKSKSSVFSMHLCEDTSEELQAAYGAAQLLASRARILEKGSTLLADKMQKEAQATQDMFGKVGDPVASDIMQTVKVWAGELNKANKALQSVDRDLTTLIEEAWRIETQDFAEDARVTAAEKLTSKLKSLGTASVPKVKMGKALYDAATLGRGLSGREAQYYPLMYFVDRSHQHVPSTCGGDYDERAIYGVSVDECASACDTKVVQPECVGFSYYDGKICLLFSRFTSVQYYTGCGESGTGADALLAIDRRTLQLATFERDTNGAQGNPYALLNFSAAKMTQNNLNGKGPDSGAAELRYSNVGIYNGQAIDLVITSDEHYYPTEKALSKLKGLVASITFGCGSDSVLTFKFVDQAGAAVKLGSWDLTIFDVDTTKTANLLEEVTIAGYDSMHMKEGAQFSVTENTDGSTLVTSTSAGQGCDNPTNPDSLDTVDCSTLGPIDQSLRSIGFRYSDTAEASLTVKMVGANPKKCNSQQGRFLLFGFQSQVSPPPPTPAPPNPDIDKEIEIPQPAVKEGLAATKCYAKLEDFVNTDLSPDLSGKNKLSLKTATEAARCFK